MNEVKSIITAIKNKEYKPIYFLMGEESYYIDKISDIIEQKVLNEEEKGFNQTVFYGRDISVEDIISTAKRFPMMSDYQVIIIKEAQDLSKNIEKIESYANNPQPSTILVFNYKYKTIDKHKKLYKTILKNGLVFESKKLYEYKIPNWINKELEENKYSIEPKASRLLVEFLGTSLSKISNELNKLMLVLPKGTLINASHIEENIGISKDFNNFELQKAIGQKNIVKANKIINYFAQNLKENPLEKTIASLNSFFTKLLSYHGLNDKTEKSVTKELRINSYFVSDYVEASRNYPMRKVSQIISLLRDADMKNKGVGTNQTKENILKELLFKILH